VSEEKRASDAKGAEAPQMIWRGNLLTWVLLMLLVLLTLGLAYLPLGRFNMPLALLIAATKGLLVAVVFMELRAAKTFIRLAAAAAFVWIAVLFALTFSDLMSRGG
jgi:cytochrome c oxidase subunit IV